MNTNDMTVSQLWSAHFADPSNVALRAAIRQRDPRCSRDLTPIPDDPLPVDLSHELSEAEGERIDLEEEVEELEGDNAVLKDENANLEDQIESLRELNQLLRNRNEELEKELAEVRAKHAPPAQH